MQRVYMQSNEHFQVFTTVLAPQARYRYRAEAEKMVAVHSYKPHWPDELELSLGDVILVLSKHEEERWLGRLQNGQQGYFPASCVMELGQGPVSARDLRRTLSLRISGWDSASDRGSGHRLQALRRGSRRGGPGEEGLEGGRGEREGPFLALRPQKPLSQSRPLDSQPPAQRSPGLLYRILSKRWKKSEYQGATNGAFEAD